jgi:hypothetical protein
MNKATTLKNGNEVHSYSASHAIIRNRILF